MILIGYKVDSRLYTIISAVTLILFATSSRGLRLPLATRRAGRETTSKSFFSKCSLPASRTNNIERLKQSILLRKVIASFDIAKNVSFFKLETCHRYVICFVTKSDVIRKDDFGRSNLEIWRKLVTTFEGKGILEPFREDVHRGRYGRSNLEASCTDGYYVLKHVPSPLFRRKRTSENDKKQRHQAEKKKHQRVSAFVRKLSGKVVRTGKKRKKNRRNGKGQGKRPKRNRRNKKRSQSISTSECEEDDSLCVRTCVGWTMNPQQCTRLRISCAFSCATVRNWALKNNFSEGTSDD